MRYDERRSREPQRRGPARSGRHVPPRTRACAFRYRSVGGGMSITTLLIDRRHLPDARHQSADAADAVEASRYRICRGQVLVSATSGLAAQPVLSPRPTMTRPASCAQRVGRHRRCLEQRVPGRPAAPIISRSWCCSADHADRSAASADGDGPLLLPAGPARLHRSGILRADEAAFPCAWRFRAGLCDCTRGRPSRADRAWRLPTRCRPEGTQRRHRARQCPAGAHGVAGRLPGGRLGQPEPPGEVASGARRYRRRAAGGFRHR